MNERIRCHVAVVVGCLRVLDRVDQESVMKEAYRVLGLSQSVELPSDFPIVGMVMEIVRDEQIEDEEIPLEEEIVEARAELQRLEMLHKAQLKDESMTPEQHLESALKIGELRAALRDLENLR